MRTDNYQRFAAHWVTVVGYGRDQDGNLNPDILIVHDPAPRSGPNLSHDYVTIERIANGTLERWKNGPKIDAAGFYKLGGGLKIKEGADFGILDGAVVLRMK